MSKKIVGTKRTRTPSPNEDDSRQLESTSSDSTHVAISADPPSSKRLRVAPSPVNGTGEQHHNIDEEDESVKDAEAGPSGLLNLQLAEAAVDRKDISEDLTSALDSQLPPPLSSRPSPFSIPTNSYEVTFRVARSYLADEEKEEDRYSPYIHLSDPTGDFAVLQDPDEIVLQAERLEISYNYPLDVTAKFTRSLASRHGQLTRKELALLICKDYQKIYEEEGMDSSPQEHTVALLMSGRMDELLARKKRNENSRKLTNKYGIWGHCLGDLDLGSVNVTMRGGVTAVCSLCVDS